MSQGIIGTRRISAWLPWYNMDGAARTSGGVGGFLVESLVVYSPLS